MGYKSDKVNKIITKYGNIIGNKIIDISTNMPNKTKGIRMENFKAAFTIAIAGCHIYIVANYKPYKRRMHLKYLNRTPKCHSKY